MKTVASDSVHVVTKRDSGDRVGSGNRRDSDTYESRNGLRNQDAMQADV